MLIIRNESIANITFFRLFFVVILFRDKRYSFLAATEEVQETLAIYPLSLYLIIIVIDEFAH